MTSTVWLLDVLDKTGDQYPEHASSGEVMSMPNKEKLIYNFGKTKDSTGYSNVFDKEDKIIPPEAVMEKFWFV